MAEPVMPPNRQFKRARSWKIFDRLFAPTRHNGETIYWAIGEVPKGEDPRRWWTILEFDGVMYLRPGFHFVNRFGYVQCANPWGGEAEDHPDYLY